jgi:hypothetical protein
VPFAKPFSSAVAVLFVLSGAARAAPLMVQPAGLFELPQAEEPARWRYRYYRRRGDDDERPYQSPSRDDAAVQSTDPAIQMLRSSSRRGGQWVDPPPPR